MLSGVRRTSRTFGLFRRYLATQTPNPQKDCTTLTPPYDALIKKLEGIKKSLLGGRPLTLAEKILFAHLHDPEQSLGGLGTDGKGQIRGERYLQLKPARVAMQDASAQMALLQFMTCGLTSSAVPTSIHCDHLIQANTGADADLQRSISNNKEVFDFLESAARKYGIEFWGPGSGIIHQIVLENYAAPGNLMLGTDSHTPNAGGLGGLAIGVGGADAVDAMTDTPWELKAPNVIGIHLTGALNGWTTPKDLILHLAGKLTVRGGTGRILEYFGPGVEAQSCTGLATISNMGAEVGATTSCFPYTKNMGSYLRATGRAPVADAADRAARAGFLSADSGVEYDEVIEINLSDLEPTINGPFTPDLSTPLSKFGDFVAQNGWKDELSAGLIGSCTNSSYEDMSRVTSIAEQARSAGLKAKVPFLCTPGSEQIRATIERDGLTETLEDVGAVVLANACGPCIGQWKRDEKQGEENAILTSFNRNFKSRNDGNSKTMNFLASPEIVTAMAFSGQLSFNPMTDSLIGADGTPFNFNPPSGSTLPSNGFALGDLSLTPAPAPTPQPDAEVVISPTSTRLEVLRPFPSHFSSGALELPPMTTLIRVRGKCTTDHISAAGPWLKYKGHLTNISENFLITATNDEGGDVNVAFDYPTQDSEAISMTIPEAAKALKSRSQPWAIVVDENYGEGSAREHAAMQPRFLGCALIVARSFARIHETNLKKQGILPLWFAKKEDYGRIASGDMIETVGLTEELFPGYLEDILWGISPRIDPLPRVFNDPAAKISLRVTKLGTGEVFMIETKHTMSAPQLSWLRAGSALNAIRDAARKTS
ncbi:aconitate hydratase [Clavulina sp. PMI_390]|nr:aconitate hydratase [Clavulina sp. PMI_390]